MITFSNIQLRHGVKLLLNEASATINPNQKVGLVGKNGCGKSSLLSLLKNEMSVDAGDFKMPEHWQIAWVNQETPALEISAIDYVIDGNRPFRDLEAQLKIATEQNNGEEIGRIHQKLDEIDAWTIEARAAALLSGLGFLPEQISQSVKQFSGGWRMRLNLAQALICHSDLLLLDEPTNHLDLDAVMWLEKWLQNYSGTLILISHDRDFLDPLVNKIIHIDQQKLNEYTGNYSRFESQKVMKLSQQQAQFERQQQKISHLQHYIDRFKAKATKAKQAQSRIKMLEKMQKIAPAQIDNPFHFEFRASDSLPSPLLRMENSEIGYDDKIILKKVKFNLVPGSRIGLLGRNGAGKSTFIKALAGKINPQSGVIELSKGISLGYFAQHQLDTLRADESPIWHLMQLSDPKISEQELRNYLGGFDFKGDKVNEPIDLFSGGEKARLVLALIVWQRPNLLLLDEPTNHLDLEMRQALTDALMDFEGAMVIVSHDRHLLRATTDEFYLVDNHLVAPFDGDLEDYQKWIAQTNKEQTIKNESNQSTSIEHKKEDRKEQKRRDAELRALLQPLKKQLSQLEVKMNQYQADLTEIETKLSDSSLYEAQNKTILTDLLKKQAEMKATLEEIELEWFDLQEQIESY